MEAKCLIPCSLQGAGSCSLLLLHLAHAVFSILFPVLLPGSTCCLRIHFVINNIAQMLVSPGGRKLLCCVLALLPTAPAQASCILVKWSLALPASGCLCFTHLLVMRFQVSVQTVSGIIYVTVILL